MEVSGKADEHSEKSPLPLTLAGVAAGELPAPSAGWEEGTSRAGTTQPECDTASAERPHSESPGRRSKLRATQAFFGRSSAIGAIPMARTIRLV